MNRIGIDVGSKTVKLVVLDENDRLVHSVYREHSSNIQKTLVSVIDEYMKRYDNAEGYAAVTGSGGISVAHLLNLPFVQEVMATTFAVRQAIPHADTIVELGGEDAKVVYLDEPLEQRMNATCAGGTGGFIDSIASMLGLYTGEMNMMAIRARHTYPLASRCAVFAQADVRPLLNAGCTREDIAASALEAVVKQTIGGLSCGRPISGNVVFLGGPFQYIPDLYDRFCRALHLTRKTGIRPEKAHLYTARGAAIHAGDVAAEEASSKQGAPSNFTSLSRIHQAAALGSLEEEGLNRLGPLFADKDEREEFEKRHATQRMTHAPVTETRGPVYVGIDAGAVSVKIAAVDDRGRIVAQISHPTGGDALTVAARMLEDLYDLLPKGDAASIAQTVATGSGDETIQYALHADSNVVETTAHLRAAQRFCPNVSFVLDAGGQDMKALWVKDGEIRDAILNDPCSSGCGTFLEETARMLQCTPANFAEMALNSTAPVELDTKCIVFMNSRVRHAQKIGASRSDISAGLAYSVAQNAFQRVIGRAGNTDFGANVVVQGGLFKSDAVLRAFEKVSGMHVLRPDTAEFMGAIGAALVARDRAEAQVDDADGRRIASSIATSDDLKAFDPVYSTYTCPGCKNACVLSIVSYGENNIYVSGNTCTKGADIVKEESIKLSEHDILGASSMIPRSKGAMRSRHVSEVGNGILIPGYQRSFSGGMAGGGGSQGISEAPRRVDYYARQQEQDIARKREKIAAARSRYLSFEDVARKEQEESQQKVAQKREQLHCRKLSLKVTASSRTLRSDQLDAPNVVALEAQALAAYGDRKGSGARGAIRIGIVNALAVYDQMPFWHTLFATLGYGVMVPDDNRTRDFAVVSAESVPSESVCDSAKTAHARIYEMADRGANALFMPRYQRNGRCPVLCEYADAVNDNVPFIWNDSMKMVSPSLKTQHVAEIAGCTDDIASLQSAFAALDPSCAPTERELARAMQKALQAQEAFITYLQQKTDDALAWIAAQPHRHGILLAGRPYHVDPQLTHGVDIMVQRMGYAVLAPLGLRNMLVDERGAASAEDIWPPASRLLRLAGFAIEHNQVDLLLLQSFNCGYDSLSVEEVRQALMEAGRPFALVKVDEMANMAHLAVRLRTFAESIEAGRRNQGCTHDAVTPSSDASASRQKGLSAYPFAHGVQRSDIDQARSSVSPDVCFTAASIIGRTLNELRDNPNVDTVHVPAVCKSCLTDVLPRFTDRASGHPITVVWDDGQKPQERPAHRAQVERSAEDRVRIGIVGNPLLCFDSFMNEHIVDLLDSLGADAVLPDLRNMQVDDIRYRKQLEDFAQNNVDAVLYLQNFNCLKGHVHGRGALHELRRAFPAMPVTVLDYDPESSALNRENRIRLVVSAARQKMKEEHDFSRQECEHPLVSAGV